MVCRVCGSQISLYDTVNGNLADVTGFFNEPITGELTDINIYRCCECGHMQTSYSLNESYYDNYNIIYNPDEDKKASGYPKKLLEYYNQCFQKMYSMAEQPQSVLDVGCASGDLLQILSEIFNNCTGIEPSENLSKQAAKKGFSVINDYFSSKIAFSEKFDCITCLMVLEHIEDLDSFMQAIYKNLAENGVVCINVPNGQKILNIGAYSDIFPEHINYFTSKSLFTLAENNGFDVVAIEEGFGDGFHLTMWLRKSNKSVLFSQKKMSDKKVLTDLTANYINIGIWGIGVRARNILNLIEEYKSSIKYLFDSNESLEGKFISNISVAISKPLCENINKCDLIIITSAEYYNEIINNLTDCKFKGDILYLKDGVYTFFK